MNFRRLLHDVDVAPILAELDAQPALWDAHRWRLDAPQSPFRDTSDIWVRMLAPDLVAQNPALIGQPHEAVPYPAWHALPSLHPLVERLVETVRATELGGILITRLPPGVHVPVHADRGWHPEHFNTKAHVALRSNPGCRNTCEDDWISMQAGEAWTFDNLLPHSVENNGSADRITAIVCMRTAA